MNNSVKENRIRAVIYWLITIGYMGTIFYVSSRHNVKLPEIARNIDKVAHMLAYVPLAYLLSMSLRDSGMKKYAFLAAFFIASIYGVTDELHQSMVPGRDATVGDVAADTVGAFIGSLGASFIKRK
jgi:VanZ family protein